MSLVFNPDGKKTILSLDGGGMRGVIPLKMLVYLEEQTGKPAYELFDLVAGTSTGAIIAAGIALGMSASEILEQAYRTRLPEVFGKQRRSLLFWTRYIFNQRMRYAYKVEPFLDALDTFARGKQIKDLTHTGVLFTTKDIRTSNTYYITNIGPGAKMFEKWPVKGAVAASAVAPIFFSPVLGDLIDAGVGSFGNPCLGATIEAVEYIGFDPKNTLHISLGTGFVSTNTAPARGSKFWLKNWVEYMLLEYLDDAALQQSYITRKLYQDQQGLDFRRYNPDLDRKNVEQVLKVDTRGMNPVAIGLDSYKASEIKLLEEIGYAYAAAIDWAAPDADMPWFTTGGHPQPSVAPVDWSNTIYL